jgi:hypothetical protein
MPIPEPRNPFYALLMLCCVVFMITALAMVFVPALEDKAREAGAEVPPSPFRAALHSDGWRFLVVEVAGILLFGILSMGLDRVRRLRRERAQPSLPPPPTDTSRNNA